MKGNDSIFSALKERAGRLFGGFQSNFLADEHIHIPRSGEKHTLDRMASILPYAHFGEDGLCAIASPDFSGYEGIGYVVEITPQTTAVQNILC